MTLDALVTLALERAPSLQAMRGRADVARGAVLQAGLRPNPTLGTERREEVGGADNQSSVTVEWPLDLFRRDGRVKVADRRLEVARRGADDAERLLVYEVRLRAGALLAAARQLEVVEALAAAMRALHDLLKARVDEGGAPPLERDLAFVEWQRIEAMRHQRRADAETALARLKAVVGVEPAASLVLRERLEPVVLEGRQAQTPRNGTDPVSTTPAAVQRRADVREAAAAIEVAEANADQVRREARFDVHLFGSYMRMESGFPQLGFTDAGELTRVRGVFHNVSVGATVMLPWRNRRQGDIAAADAARRVATYERDARVLEAQHEIAAARVRDEEARRALDIYGAGVRETARRNLAVIRESHALGRVTLFEVLAEQRRSLDVEMAYTDALASAFDAHIVLLRALGESK